jgi:hypothetical protein
MGRSLLTQWTFDVAQCISCPGCEVSYMLRIKELIELAKQSYALANDTLHPETKKGLQDLAAKYEQQANELRRIEVTRAVFPNEKK